MVWEVKPFLTPLGECPICSFSSSSNHSDPGRYLRMQICNDDEETGPAKAQGDCFDGPGRVCELRLRRSW